MKTTAMHLLILDDNTLMADPLSNYLSNKFGARVKISTFSNADNCMLSIDAQSHVIILDYFLKDKNTTNGLKNFNSIKKKNPKTDVTMITSSGDIATATEEMRRGTSEYIIRRERYLYDILHLFDKVLVSPITAVVMFPIHRIAHFYNVKKYLAIFLTAFISIGILVAIAFFVKNYFFN